MKFIKVAGLLACFEGLIFAFGAAVTADDSDYKFTVPSTVSEEASVVLERLYKYFAMRPDYEKPQTLEDWDRQKERIDQIVGRGARAYAERMEASVTEETIGGVPVVRIRPAGYSPDSRMIVYTHGGAYVLLSAKTSLTLPVMLAAATGLEVVSIDYTLAPRADWHKATDEVLAVWSALLESGRDASSMALFGDSAGGGLAAGSTLKMRDKGLPMPGALYLVSPWSDITVTGDTYTTLAAADPSLSADSLAWSAKAYAAEEDQKHPYVSPVYGDYSKAFPPTLIQGGTREIFLSNFVRHYQAVKAGGHTSVLDLYEGMPHVFQGLVTDAPESKAATETAASFIMQHIGN